MPKQLRTLLLTLVTVALLMLGLSPMSATAHGPGHGRDVIPIPQDGVCAPRR